MRKKQRSVLIKEYIIDLYKDLIDNLDNLTIDEIMDNYFSLGEHVDSLCLEDLKECYNWKKKFEEALMNSHQIEIDEKSILEDAFIWFKDKEFYYLFGFIMDFEKKKNALLERIKNNDESAKFELEELYNSLRETISAQEFKSKWQVLRDKIHGPLLKMMNTTLKFDQIDGYQYENVYASEEDKQRQIKSLYHESVHDELDISFNPDIRNIDKLKALDEINGPIIFAVNHTNSHDIPLACKVIQKRASVLAGDEIRYDINGLLLTMNDVTWVTRHDTRSRWQSKYDICLKLLNGLSNIMFVEGTWNMTENNPMLPFNWGIIEIAQITECPIVPILLEYTPDSCIIKVGDPISVSIYDDKKEAIDNLRNQMATMRWYTWEQKTLNNPEMSKEEFQRDYVEKHLKEYPKLDVDYEKSVIFKIEDTPERVFEPINKLVRKK